MATFLYFIGTVNLLGVVMLFAALREDVHDLLLRRWTRILRADEPARHGNGSRLWTVWAAVGTLGFAWLNLRAAGGNPAWMAEVVRMDVLVYGAFEVMAIVGTASRKFGPGMWVCHPLWIGQGGWGLAVLLNGT
ncbi:MAG: hypothetical protein Q8Q09_06520 [Deltaproteobacteria bacterium]|nr:hypothetical protein [Deltaproteobacteria bacterium]